MFLKCVCTCFFVMWLFMFSFLDQVKEDVLWTEKYQPQHSSEVIGNMESVRRLHRLLCCLV